LASWANSEGFCPEPEDGILKQQTPSTEQKVDKKVNFQKIDSQVDQK
jgi:hypothetical protein